MGGVIYWVGGVNVLVGEVNYWAGGAIILSGRSYCIVYKAIVEQYVESLLSSCFDFHFQLVLLCVLIQYLGH